MGENAADVAAVDQDDGQAGAAPLDSVQYCSEHHREPKPSKMRGTDAAADEDDVYEHHQHRIKCSGFFGGMGLAGRGLLRAL
jgi:hypothetical protein